MRTSLRLLGLLSIVALASGFSGDLAAADNELEYSLTLATGVDTNPLEVSSDGPDGSFTFVGFNGNFSSELSDRTRYFLDGGVRTRLHESTASDADRIAGHVRTGFSLLPRRWGHGRLAFTVGTEYSVRRSTFIDSETGEIYDISTGSGPVAIPDRYDYDDLELFFKTYWKLNRRVRFSLGAEWHQADYVEDYSEIPDFYALDSNSLVVTPGMRLRINRMATLYASVKFIDRDYDNRPALDMDGDEVDGTNREYHDTRYSLTVLLKPERWKLRLGLSGADRSDTFVGYYDYASTGTRVSVQREIGTRSTVQLYASARELEYDNALVPGDPSLETRGKDVTRFTARYDRRFLQRFSWFVEGGSERTDSQDPYWAYDSDWFQAGVRFRRCADQDCK